MCDASIMHNNKRTCTYVSGAQCLHVETTIDTATCLCRLCQPSMPSDIAVSLFSQTEVKQRLTCRIKDLLDVPVASKDCLPEHICCKCKQKLERLERTAEELEDFRMEASSTYNVLHTCFKTKGA